ncbi:hypothetical protein STEG23_005930, partial [Scotinomys teguina]
MWCCCGIPSDFYCATQTCQDVASMNDICLHTTMLHVMMITDRTSETKKDGFWKRTIDFCKRNQVGTSVIDTSLAFTV